MAESPLPADKQTPQVTAQKILGCVGRMISSSKSDYDRRHPKNIVVFNANVCTRTHGKIWYGDLDVTKDKKALQALFAALGEDVFVLHEMDARFQTEASPLLDRARATVSPSGVQIHERKW